MLLADVFGKVKEHGITFTRFDHQLPVTHTRRVLLSRSPEQPIVRTSVFLAREVRNQIDAVERSRTRGIHACGGKCRGVTIEAHDHLSIDSTGWQRAFPLHQERHSDPALEHLALDTTQRIVARRRLPGWTTIVTVEEDERVLLQSVLAELAQHAANGVVHCRGHSGIGSTFAVGDLRETLFVLGRRLQR